MAGNDNGEGGAAAAGAGLMAGNDDGGCGDVEAVEEGGQDMKGKLKGDGGKLPIMIDSIPISDYDHDSDLIAMVRRTRTPRIRVYRPPGPAVVLGRGSRPEVELHLEACLEDRIPLLRRNGGGCSVFIEPGDVIVAAVLPLDGIGRVDAWFDHLTRWVIRALDAAGISKVERAGSSDLVIGDHKIAGASMHQSREVLAYGAILLVDPNIDLIERYLKHPPREPAYRRGRPHRDFVGTLAELSPTHPTPAMLADRLNRILTPPEPLP